RGFVIDHSLRSQLPAPRSVRVRVRGAWHAVSFIFTFIFGSVCVLALPIRSSCATRRDVSGQAIYDVVGVGFGPHEILLATPIGRSGRLTWRFRNIALSDASDPP